MEVEIKIKMNERLFLRDPESSDLGKKIIRTSIEMINVLGFEDFTFKKLAIEIGTTEAGIYRYFENKHRILVYILAWYWNLFEYQLERENLKETDPEQKIKNMISLLSTTIDTEVLGKEINAEALQQIVIAESNKVYLTKNVGDNNDAKLFKPYKDLCLCIAQLFLTYNPQYNYAHSLASTLIETSHLQHFFSEHLPALTDFKTNNKNTLSGFLHNLVFGALNQK
jgi:AcrR family transcriptional regulator